MREQKNPGDEIIDDDASFGEVKRGVELGMKVLKVKALRMRR